MCSNVNTALAVCQQCNVTPAGREGAGTGSKDGRVETVGTVARGTTSWPMEVAIGQHHTPECCSLLYILASCWMNKLNVHAEKCRYVLCGHRHLVIHSSGRLDLVSGMCLFIEFVEGVLN